MSGSTPAFPASTPYGAPQPVGPVARPKQVEIAFWLFLGAALVSLISLIVSVATFPAVRDTALKQIDAQGNSDVLDPSTIDAIVTTSFVVGIVFAVLWIALYVLFAIFVRKGHGWARWVFVALSALSLFGILGQYGLGALQAALLIAGTLLTLIPVASRQFFAAARANRLAKRNVA
ncbi:hypothetical protein [Naasia aerilata]|uniref:DUF2127 domain-containing protein n=1 Tax=Naasia aerilata TaxID=1162966 RepID=A0ABM8GDZ9_9MICO|nr:hypothetical protein [Naasia aerilata]BDZ46521.1 hypothetical protein GCM10025866_24300 [Naasia aerilata]